MASALWTWPEVLDDPEEIAGAGALEKRTEIGLALEDGDDVSAFVARDGEWQRRSRSRRPRSENVADATDLVVDGFAQPPAVGTGAQRTVSASARAHAGGRGFQFGPNFWISLAAQLGCTT